MRGDWIYDWVQVEMEYRTGPAPAQRKHRRSRPAPRHWAALWAGLFTGNRPEVRHSSPATGC